MAIGRPATGALNRVVRLRGPPTAEPHSTAPPATRTAADELCKTRASKAQQSLQPDHHDIVVSRCTPRVFYELQIRTQRQVVHRLPTIEQLEHVFGMLYGHVVVTERVL